MAFNVSPAGPCPCESGKASNACCWSSTGFKCKVASTKPPGPATGRALENCYASSLGDCGPTLSREHYISESILRRLNVAKGLHAQGFPWQKDAAPQPIPPSALTARVLCDRHNAALSPLDSIAERLFAALDEENIADAPEGILRLFNGHDFERWLLKVLCGVAASGQLTLPQPTDTSIQRSWIEVLFGRSDFDAELGLYVCRTPGTSFSGPKGVEFAPIGEYGKLIGLLLCICGYEFILSMDAIPGRHLLGRHLAYRPMEFHVTGQSYEKSVIFTWDQPGDGGTVHLNIPTKQPTPISGA